MIKLLLLLAAVSGNLKHWLYRLGNEFTSLTGGWQSRAWTGNRSIWTAKAPGLNKNAGSMTVSMTDKYSSGKSGVVEILNNVDLTPYATLRVKLNLAIGGCGSEGYQRIYLVCAADRSASNNWTSSAIYKAIRRYSPNVVQRFHGSERRIHAGRQRVNQAVDAFFGLVGYSRR
jgi:hypothetical protein